MIDVKSENYERITKPTARKLFCSGEDIYVCGCKVNPDNKWGLLVKVSTPFDRFVDEFRVYGCSPELGLYPAFYRKR